MDPGRILAYSLALKSTGPISLGQIQNVFGVTRLPAQSAVEEWAFAHGLITSGRFSPTWQLTYEPAVAHFLLSLSTLRTRRRLLSPLSRASAYPSSSPYLPCAAVESKTDPIPTALSDRARASGGVGVASIDRIGFRARPSTEHQPSPYLPCAAAESKIDPIPAALSDRARACGGGGRRRVELPHRIRGEAEDGAPLVLSPSCSRCCLLSLYLAHPSPAAISSTSCTSRLLLYLDKVQENVPSCGWWSDSLALYSLQMTFRWCLFVLISL